MPFISILILFLILFLLSQKIHTGLYRFYYLLTLSEKFSIGMLSLILIPGTIIHELSHFLLATILRVPTGKISVYPEILGKGIVRAGKLEIGNCDPFRKTLIGIAPMFVGLVFIYFIGQFFFSSFQPPTTNYQLLTIIIGLYFLLTVSVTMFSSPKDLESIVIVLPILFIFIVILYLLGLRISFTNTLINQLEDIVRKLNSVLFLTIIINLVVLIINMLGINFFQKIFNRKLVKK